MCAKDFSSFLKQKVGAGLKESMEKTYNSLNECFHFFVRLTDLPKELFSDNSEEIASVDKVILDLENSMRASWQRVNPGKKLPEQPPPDFQVPNLLIKNPAARPGVLVDRVIFFRKILNESSKLPEKKKVENLRKVTQESIKLFFYIADMYQNSYAALIEQLLNAPQRLIMLEGQAEVLAADLQARSQQQVPGGLGKLRDRFTFLPTFSFEIQAGIAAKLKNDDVFKSKVAQRPSEEQLKVMTGVLQQLLPSIQKYSQVIDGVHEQLTKYIRYLSLETSGTRAWVMSLAEIAQRAG